jgi:hypothetical protein
VTEPQDRIAEVWNDAVGQHIAGLSQDDYDTMVARFRPQPAPAPAPPAPVDESNLPITRRSGFTAKVDQLAELAQSCGPNGYTQGITDAVAARAPQAPPEPEPVVQQGPTPFAVNRGQSQSSSGAPMPEIEANRNRRLIGDHLMKKGLK